MSALALLACLSASGVAVLTGSSGSFCAVGAQLCVCDADGKVTSYCVRAECLERFEAGQKVS